MKFDGYRRSLKLPEAEELLDLILFRPLGYAVAKALEQTPLTPNQLTSFSLVLGFAAAAAFFVGTTQALVWGAVFYGLANVFDCADGQLARLKGSGTAFGRVWDGVADYLSSAAVFLGIGFGLRDSAWGLVVAAGLTSAFHALMFDHYQAAFISSAIGKSRHEDREVERYTEEVRRLNDENRGVVKVFFLRIYLLYLNVQARLGRAEVQAPPSRQARTIRLWSFLGPSTNRTLLIVCAFFARIDLFLWAVVAGGNAWFLVCSFLQRRLPPSGVPGTMPSPDA